MALSNNRYGEVSTIRAYFDVVQYAKAIGYVKELFSYQNSPVIDSESSPFDYNPAKVETYAVDGTYDYLSFVCHFKSRIEGDRNFAQLLKSINYYGIFGHNIQTASADYDQTALQCFGHDGLQNLFAYPQSYTEIVGDRTDVGNGYTIVGVDDWSESDSKRFEGLEVQIQSDTTFTDSDAFNVGAISVGRYMDFPHSANLSMNIKYNYDGIKSKNSTSGRTINNINYYKPPDWGNYPRWTHISKGTLVSTTDEDWVNKYNMKAVSGNGRREWDLTWSFLSKEDTFPKISEGNMFAHNMDKARYTDDGVDALSLKSNDSIISTMMTLSLGGNIPFLLQMDNTQQDFAFVRINQKSISIQQSAPNLYTCKMKLQECW